MDTVSGQWYKLETGNDWGYRFFIDPRMKDSSRASREFELKFFNGQKADIKWPDGFESIERLVTKSFYDKVYDMGHSYEVSYTLVGVVGDFHGVKKWIPLDKVEIWLRDKV
ncbi:MAG: hypothetical protein KGL39_44345 [Patescibacteria group bacterium]|nr:hypothetical protein [Patescibacteria group bacterium]